MQSISTKYDAIIIGSGLAGLVAGLNLQMDGYKVLIIDKRDVPGGLCGTKIIDGYEFTIACNDFGLGMEREMKKLEVPVKFHKPKNLFVFEHGKYQIPMNLPTIWNLIPHLRDIFRLLKAFRNNKQGKRYEYLGSILNEKIKSSKFKDSLGLIIYALGIPSSEIRINAIKEEFSKEFNYGYHQPITPIGGPKVLIDKMVKKIEDMGGDILLETECINIEKENNLKKVVTNNDSCYSKYVISSQGRWNQYPTNFKTGTAVSMFYIAVKKTLQYPKNIHTLAYLPPKVDKWLSDINKGEFPPEFGFHLFKNDLPEKPDHYTINIYFFLPRGMENPDTKYVEQAEKYIFTKAEKLLPGLNDSILYKKFLSPSDFIDLHGLSSRITEYVMKAGFQKPDIYDPETDIYYIGNSVFPPGEHSGGAILSGAMAVEMIKKRKNKSY